MRPLSMDETWCDGWSREKTRNCTNNRRANKKKLRIIFAKPNLCVGRGRVEGQVHKFLTMKKTPPLSSTKIQDVSAVLSGDASGYITCDWALGVVLWGMALSRMREQVHRRK